MGSCISTHEEGAATVTGLYSTTTQSALEENTALPTSVSTSLAALHLPLALGNPQHSRDTSNSAWLDDSVTLRNSNRNNNYESTADAPHATPTHETSSNYALLEQCATPVSLGALTPLPHVPASSKETPLRSEAEAQVLTTQVPETRRSDEQSLLGQRRSFGEVKDSDASLTMCFDQELHSSELQTAGGPMATPPTSAIAARKHNITSYHRANHVVHVQGDQFGAQRVTLKGSATASASTLQPLWDSGADDVQNPLALPRLGGGQDSKRNSITTGASTSGGSLQAFVQIRVPSYDSLVDPDSAPHLRAGSLTSVMSPKSGIPAPGAPWRSTANAAGFSMDSFVLLQSHNVVNTSMASSRGFGSSGPLLLHNGEDFEWNLPKFRAERNR
jgi:hypothetical protein